MSNPIRFGTDGWRAIMAEDYTFANLRLLSTALADYLQQNEATKVPQGRSKRLRYFECIYSLFL